MGLAHTEPTVSAQRTLSLAAGVPVWTQCNTELREIKRAHPKIMDEGGSRTQERTPKSRNVSAVPRILKLGSLVHSTSKSQRGRPSRSKARILWLLTVVSHDGASLHRSTRRSCEVAFRNTCWYQLFRYGSGPRHRAMAKHARGCPQVRRRGGGDGGGVCV